MDVHRLAKVADDSIGAEAASFVLVRIAAFAMQHLFVPDSHAAPANPVLSVA
jgi:hypothetical protein